MRQSVGKLGEQIAAKYLRGQGYDILATNFHTGKWGEIDIIAQKDKRLFFIEVRTKTGTLFGAAEESLTLKKKQHLKHAIYYYLSSQRIKFERYQVDFLAVYLDRWNHKTIVKHYQNIAL